MPALEITSETAAVTLEPLQHRPSDWTFAAGEKISARYPARWASLCAHKNVQVTGAFADSSLLSLNEHSGGLVATYVFQPLVFNGIKISMPTYLASWKLDVGAGTWSQ